MQKFTAQEVAKHNTKTDCWIIIKKQVYDVTSFLSEHPGGGDLLSDLAGQDATADFEDAGHSKDAINQMKKYLIGTVG